MNSAASPSVESYCSARCEALLTTLSSTLGTPFQLWMAHPDELSSENTVSSHIAKPKVGESKRRPLHGAEVAAALERARQHGCGTLDLEDGTLGVWIRLPGIVRRKLIAFGTVMNANFVQTPLLIDAACKLIAQQVELSDQSADMDSCLENLTYGLEEQTWLRSLSNHLTLCSARRSLRDVAVELLPSLRQLVGAESIAILLTGTITSQCEESTPVQTILTSVLWDVPQTVDDQSLQTWLDRQPATPQSRPVVQNGNRVDAKLRCLDIRSLCTVQICRGDTVFGWVVAVNRTPYRRDSLDEMPRGMSEVEFGTVEAGLVEAATKMLATHGHNVELLQDREDLVIGVIRAMGHAVDARDPYTRGHSERVGRYGRQLAEAIGLDDHDCDRIYLSGLLHDVGKIGIPDAVLGKTGRLTEDEFAIVQRHPEIGARIIQTLPQLSDLMPGILHHHESFDGSGYPHGLQGDAIPLMGRILAVADAYDAMTSDRPYRQGMPREKAVAILESRAGIQWDAELVRVFLAIPESELVLEAVDGDQGWNTEDHWLRSGAESMFGHRMSTTVASEILDDSLPLIVLTSSTHSSGNAI